MTGSGVKRDPCPVYKRGSRTGIGGQLVGEEDGVGRKEIKYTRKRNAGEGKKRRLEERTR